MNELESTRVAEIVSLHNEIKEFCRTALDRAIRIYELLTAQKEALPHRAFGPWLGPTYRSSSDPPNTA